MNMLLHEQQHIWSGIIPPIRVQWTRKQPLTAYRGRPEIVINGEVPEFVEEKLLRPASEQQGSWLEINLDHAAYNAGVIKERFGRNRLVMGCIKAEAYGHGLEEIGRAYVAGGVDRLCVAWVSEGIRLRQAGIEAPIQLLMEPPPEAAEEIAHYDLIPSISSPETAKAMASRLKQKVKIHVEVDTGMGRTRLKPADVVRFFDLLASLSVFEIEGLFTHFTSAHIPNDPVCREATADQLKTFLDVIDQVKAAGWNVPLIHAANSAGTILYPASRFDMIRPGFLFLGVKIPWVDLPLRPIMTWKSRVLSVWTVEAGESVGYESGYRPRRDTRIASIAVGYGDGLPRAISGKGEVLIKGRRAPVVGLVAMDQSLVEVAGIPDVAPGDEVVVFGPQGEENNSQYDIALRLGDSPAAMTCGLSPRVRRVWLGSNMDGSK